MSARGARDIIFTQLVDRGWNIDVGLHLRINGSWVLADDWQNASGDWDRENAVANPRITIDRVVEHENTTGSNQTITEARVVIGTSGVGIPDPFMVFIPEGGITGAPITLQPGQKLIFNENQIKVQL